MTTSALRRLGPAFVVLAVLLGWSPEALATTFVGGAITTNTTWTLAASPYEVTSTVTISSYARLTVQAGVVVRFRTGTALQVGHPTFDHCESNCLEIGRLTVLGTAASPVLFTSKSGLSGGWRGVAFGPASDRSGTGASLSFLTVEKAGQAPPVLGIPTPCISLLGTGQGFVWNHVSTNGGAGDGLRLTDSELTVSASSSLANAGVGIRALRSHLDLTTSIVSDNLGGGLTLRDVSGAVSKSVVGGNGGVGITLEDSTQTFTDNDAFTISSNEISANGSYAITFFFKNRPQISSNTLLKNSKPGIRVTGGTVIVPAPWRRQIGETNFDVVGESVQLTTNNALVIDPGVVVRFANHTGLEIGTETGSPGTLVAEGTPASPITFTAMPPAVPGAWRGLFFAPNFLGQSSLHHVVVENAGEPYPTDHGPFLDMAAGVIVHDTGTFFAGWEDVEVRASDADGLYLIDADLHVVGGRYAENALAGINVFHSALHLDGAELSDNGDVGLFIFSNPAGLIHDSLIHDNGKDGIFALSAPYTITANLITDNGGYGIRYTLNRSTSIVGNTLGGNLSPGVLGDGPALTRDEVWSPQMGEPFLTLTEDITVSNSAELRIEAGLTASFPPNGGLRVGYPDDDCGPGSPPDCVAILSSLLTIQGTALAPVRLRSTSGVPGSWRGVFLGPVSDQGGLARIDYTIIEHAGQPRASQSQGPTLGGALTLLGTTAVLDNLTITSSTGPGIVTQNSSPLVKNTVVAFNTGAGLHGIGSGAPSFTFGVLHGNAANVGWAPGASTLITDPLFVDAPAGNYTPLAGSPCIDSGTSVGLPFLGAAPNRGAIE